MKTKAFETHRELLAQKKIITALVADVKKLKADMYGEADEDTEPPDADAVLHEPPCAFYAEPPTLDHHAPYVFLPFI